MPADLTANTRFIGLEDIASEEGQIVNLSHASDVRSRVFQFQNGDVLYGRLRPYLRKAAVADFDGCASGEIIVIRCSEKILPRYLLVLLLSEDFNRFVNARVKGDRPRTSFATIAKYRFDLPSLESQAEVCDRDSRLLAAMSVLSNAVAKLENAASVLVEAMRAKLIWNASTEGRRVPMADATVSIDYGTTKRSSYGGSGTPVLRIPNVVSGKIDVSDLKYAPLSRQEIEKYRLKVGDILLIRSNGSLSLVGRAAKIDEDHLNHIFAGYLLRIRPRDDVMSTYLLELLRSSPFRRMIEAAARSSTGINNLSAGRLADFLVPIPEIKHQARIVDTLARLQHAIGRYTEDLSNAWSGAKALQKTARRGWLGQATPQLPKRAVSSQLKDFDKPNFDDVRELPMDENIETTLLKRLDALPLQMGSFEALSDGLRGDYDELRDAVFKLLAAAPPALEQIFDKQSRSIILRRPK